MNTLFSFPDPVNDYAARFVAAMVVILTISFLATANIWVLIFILYGFLARVLTGPTLSPIGLIATKILVPLFGNPEKLVPGPPKRFAQAIGLVFSAAALIALLFSEISVTRYLIGILGFFASLEAFIGFCTGCYVFGWLIRFRLIPESVCESCKIDYSTNNDI
ncbi:MAG TPA: DUF4395 domain-containing protein [Dehalococcoidia bacterium]|nr:DUF4395 domain-containing protein [Dehalococcoidia bacterium]